MSWIERVRQHKIITGAVAFIAFIGGINTLSDLTEKEWFKEGTAWVVTHTGGLTTGVTVPVWSLLLVSIMAALAVAYIVRQLMRRGTLNEPDERVLFWTTNIRNWQATGQGPTPAEIAKISKIDLIDVEASLDVLKRKGLVLKKRYRGDPVSLSPAAYDYLKRQDVKRRHVAFSIHATREYVLQGN